MTTGRSSYMNARIGKKLRVPKIEKKTYPKRQSSVRGAVRGAIQGTHEGNWVRQKQCLKKVEYWEDIVLFEANILDEPSACGVGEFEGHTVRMSAAQLQHCYQGKKQGYFEGCLTPHFEAP
jgi:hypothetical protein